VGFDFPYGYPRHTAEALGFSDRKGTWQRIWVELSSRITDSEDNRNNRFSVASELDDIISDGKPGPFWGCPPSQATQHLATKSPGFPFKAANGQELGRLRVCEERLKGTQEVWKLLGAGCVGSQALTGIPCVHSLRNQDELRDISKVWPFETGFTSAPSPGAGPHILHAEIWPGIVDREVRRMTARNIDLIRDQAQVRALCEWAAELDRKGELGSYFDVPDDMDSAGIEQCIQEEGWVLGIGWIDKGKIQPDLETDRLLLRPFELSDAPRVKELAGDRAIADTTLNIPHPYEDGMAEEWISTHQPKFESGELANRAIVLESTGELIGAIGMTVANRFNRAELGYWIGKEYWSQGYCTEGAKAMIGYGFREMGLHKIVASHLTRNPASGRVMQKIGMKKEALFQEHVIKWGKYEDVVYYGILRSEWGIDT